MKALAAALLCCVAVAGCGARPPEAPPAAASKINDSLSTMAFACGVARVRTEYPPTHPGALVEPERNATKAIPPLVGVLRRNPAWIYQNVTVAGLVSQAESMLTDCGLHRAARRLHAAAARAHR